MPEQGLPINPVQKALTEILAATPAVWDALAGDKVFDQLVPPMTGATTVRPMPYLAWGHVSDTPHADQSSAFGEAGSASTFMLHVFDAHKFTKSFAMDLADQIKRRLSGKQHTLEGGFKMLTCLVSLVDCVSVPTGQQAVLSISTTTRTVAGP